jgi:hypothetical protein
VTQVIIAAGSKVDLQQRVFYSFGVTPLPPVFAFFYSKKGNISKSKSGGTYEYAR